MRTTINVDDDLFKAAKALAAQRHVAIGEVVSDLMRKGLNAESRIKLIKSSGFTVFEVPADARPITLETVKEAEDEL